MEFGLVSPEELGKIDFTIPPDHQANREVLKGVEQPTQVYVGCAKWGRKDWVGRIYPKGTPESDFLKHYARHFNAIELNATFYKLPSKTQTRSWSSGVGDNFRFCPKVSDKISHIKRLKDTGALVERFLDGISGFGKTLGPIFLMLHPQMGPKTTDTIQAFLESMPRDLQLFVELRNPKWYADQAVFDRIFDVLAQSNTGAVITDVAGRRDCLHMRLTTPHAFIRFVGNGLHPTDYTRVDDWVERIAQWMKQGLKSVYFFMHQHEEIHSPELCRYVIRQLNAKCGTSLREPEFVGEDSR